MDIEKVIKDYIKTKNTDFPKSPYTYIDISFEKRESEIAKKVKVYPK